MKTYGGKHMSASALKEKDLKEYKCGWCGYEFKQYVGKYECSDEIGMAKGKQNVSSQVQCQQCYNFIPTGFK